jgi:uncharacterized membrane protein (UPF0127 family)
MTRLAATASALAFLASCGPTTAPTTTTVTVNGKSFSCRLALDNATRAKGLGGVTSLGPDEGMLFVFTDAEERNFWMVDCLMDIDIAYISPLGFVTAVHTMPKQPPQSEGESRFDYEKRLPRYPSGGPAQFALEVAPGTLANLGVRRGTRVEFDQDTLKKFAD